MTAKPFEPKGEVARWVPVYHRLRDMAIGEVITYAELSELAGVDIRYDRSPFTRAAKELLDENQRATMNIPDEGYAIAHPSQQSELARRQAKKADRRIAAAISLVHNVDQNYLTPDQRNRIEQQGSALSALHDMMKRLNRRQDKLDNALKTVRRENKETTAELSERLERLENRLLAREEQTHS